jgi:hypothetical protein
MSSYSEPQQAESAQIGYGEAGIDRIPPSLEILVSKRAELLYKEVGIDYKELSPIQRLFLAHYRCPMCKLVPLYHIDIRHPKMMRCRKCGNLVKFTNSGKYDRLGKKIAFALWHLND